jgi:hypothetical protein
MIQRDIAELVRACIEDQASQSTGSKGRRAGTIDTVLHAELDAFTSLDFDNGPDNGPQDGQVTAPADGGVQVGSFIDPRAWSAEADWPGRRSGRRDTVGDFARRDSATLRRDTVAEMQVRSSQSMPSPVPPPSAVPPQGAPTGSQSALQPRTNSQPVPQPQPRTDSQPPPPQPTPSSFASLSPAVTPPRTMGRGLLFGVMAAAVVIGAVFAWLLFSGR